jgi:hypothetical protein
MAFPFLGRGFLAKQHLTENETPLFCLVAATLPCGAGYQPAGRLAIGHAAVHNRRAGFNPAPHSDDLGPK